MDLYRLLFVFAIIAFIVIKVILITVKPLKNCYSYNMTEDDLFKSFKDDYGYNRIYSTSGETRNYINKYVLRVNHSTKTLICNYTKYFEEISFFIVCMGNKKPIKIYKINEKNTKTKTSKIFLLPPKTKRVNVVISEVDGMSFNDKIVAPIPKSNCRLYAWLSSLSLLSLMYIIRQLIVEIFLNGFQEVFYDEIYNYITLLIIFGMFVLNLITTASGLRKRNWKTKVGGSLEYEFF